MDNVVEELLRRFSKYRGQCTLNNSIAANYSLAQGIQTFANLKFKGFVKFYIIKYQI